MAHSAVAVQVVGVVGFADDHLGAAGCCWVEVTGKFEVALE